MTPEASEPPTWKSGEHLIAARCENDEVRSKFQAFFDDYMRTIEAAGVDLLGSQPTQGNIRGGLSTIEEKAMGNIAKTGTAPVVGVYYSASSPGADPFVSVGSRVVPGQVLCILEAMKLMNEITSEFAGVVARVIPENGQLVSLGDDLFWIEP